MNPFCFFRYLRPRYLLPRNHLITGGMRWYDYLVIPGSLAVVVIWVAGAIDVYVLQSVPANIVRFSSTGTDTDHYIIQQSMAGSVQASVWMSAVSDHVKMMDSTWPVNLEGLPLHAPLLPQFKRLEDRVSDLYLAKDAAERAFRPYEDSKAFALQLIASVTNGDTPPGPIERAELCSAVTTTESLRGPAYFETSNLARGLKSQGANLAHTTGTMDHLWHGTTKNLRHPGFQGSLKTWRFFGSLFGTALTTFQQTTSDLQKRMENVYNLIAASAANNTVIAAGGDAYGVVLQRDQILWENFKVEYCR